MTRRHTAALGCRPGSQLPPPPEAHLNQVGWQHVVPVAVIEGKSRGEAGHGDARLDARADCPPPGVLRGKHKAPSPGECFHQMPQSKPETVPHPAWGHPPGSLRQLT